MVILSEKEPKMLSKGVMENMRGGSEEKCAIPSASSTPSPQSYTGCSLNIVLFPEILEILPPPPRQHSAAIGCTKNYQPIELTIHSHCVEIFEGLLQRCRRGRGCSEL